MPAKQKLTVYVPDGIHEEMKAEADRQDRSVSWLVEHCWKMARNRMQSYPGVSELVEDVAADHT
ncbi:MAG: TIGR04563 family protein [Deltaproteobacteria bacterium]|nr:MAG: TIGR04563 family protein [Deltaproteobacteria bacterium]